MKKYFNEYIKEINEQIKLGVAKELSYRPAFNKLLQSILPSLQFTMEPSHIDNNAPDFAIFNNHVNIGYIETKDLNANLSSKSYQEQFERYRNAFELVIFTNYLYFEIWQNGELIADGTFATIVNTSKGKKAVLISQIEHEVFKLVDVLSVAKPIKIRSPRKLARIMANKSRMLADVIEKSLIYDINNVQDSNIKYNYKLFKRALIHDLTVTEFSDIYAQTIAYGLFAARLNDDSPKNFSREEAARLIPMSNPTLRTLFQEIAGPNIDNRIKWMIDSLVDTFSAVITDKIMETFSTDKKSDPLIHFYEDFLFEYDPETRKKRGVWYTPEPVVDFIVRNVDEILENKLNIPGGLASEETIQIKTEQYFGKSKNRKYGYRTIPKVQILDPATGTGTFLAKTISQIYTHFEGNEGLWDEFAENQLIPRLNGFELLMAPYAVTHLKLSLQMQNTMNKKLNLSTRFNVFLTNTLEEPDGEIQNLLVSKWLSDETLEANRIKSETPIMIVMGNPPYSLSSSNQGPWIKNLVSDYLEGLNERNPRIDDDYIKFIRYAEDLIERQDEGIIAFITNNNYLDGLTHRKMREHLATTFDDIYIIDLHGNNRSGETKNGDENIFDIQVGVAISIFIKTKNKENKNKLATIHTTDIVGSRKYKYEWLQSNSIESINWKLINLDKNDKQKYFKDVFFNEEKYDDTFVSLKNLFLRSVSGFATQNDDFVLWDTETEVQNLYSEFIDETKNDDDIINKYIYRGSDKIKQAWSFNQARKDIINNESKVIKVSYRPFDNKYTLFTGNIGFNGRPRRIESRSLLSSNNYALISAKQNPQKNHNDFSNITIENNPVDLNYLQPRGGTVMFPVFIDENEKFDHIMDINLVSNLRTSEVRKLLKNTKIKYNNELLDYSIKENVVGSLEMINYITGILFMNNYREKYKMQLKKDFPKIPPAKNKDTFVEICSFGKQITGIFLEETKILTSNFPAPGNKLVVKGEWKNDAIWINSEQTFSNVSKSDWDYYVGGYQPLQQFLKMRKNRMLSNAEINTYRKTIETIKQLQKIQKEMKESILIQNFFI